MSKITKLSRSQAKSEKVLAFISLKLLKSNIMKIIFIFGILFNICLISASGNIYYNIEMYYDKGRLEVVGVDIELSQFEEYNFVEEDRENILELKGVGGVLNSVEFSVPNFAISDLYNETSGEFYGGEIIEYENVSFNLMIPYNEDAKEIVVYDINENEIIREDVSGFAKAEVEVKEVVDEIDDRERDVIYYSGDKSSRIENVVLWILGGVLVVLILVFVWFLGKGKRR